MTYKILLVGRIIFGIFSFLFFTFAILQWNDSYALLWFLIYLFGGIFCLKAALGRKNSPLLLGSFILLAVFYAIYLSYLGSQELAQVSSWIKVEYLREAIGLLITVFILGSQWAWQSFIKSHRFLKNS